MLTFKDSSFLFELQSILKLGQTLMSQVVHRGLFLSLSLSPFSAGHLGRKKGRELSKELACISCTEKLPFLKLANLVPRVSLRCLPCWLVVSDVVLLRPTKQRRETLGHDVTKWVVKFGAKSRAWRQVKASSGASGVKSRARTPRRKP